MYSFASSLRHFCLLWVVSLLGSSCGNYPVLDVDTNMRIVLVPHDTPVGTVIYRLRASDSDLNFPLTFDVLGALGKSLLAINFLGCVESENLCQADVVIKKPLDVGRTYEFQLQVKDTVGDYTKVHATITSTMGSYVFGPLWAPRIMHLAEDCQEGTLLERFDVLKNEGNSRVAQLEIRDKEERIGLKQRLVSNNMTEGTLFLKRKLDYETQPWFTFQLLAMNAWTNESVDTRNILMSEVIVAVHDVQDTPPQFTLLPSSVELNSSLKMGDLIIKVQAEDGDKQNKRLIRYGFLTDSNPFVVFFDLDPMTGEIRLRRNMTELLKIAKPNEPIKMTIIAEEIISDASNSLFGRTTRRTSPSLERTMGNITFWFGLGGSGTGGGAYGPPVFSSNRYMGQVPENALPGTLVQFGPMSITNLNPSDLIMLSLSPSKVKRGFIGPINRNDELLITSSFEIIPSQGYGNFSFEIRVVDSKMLDYEVYHDLKLLITAASSSSSEAEVTIYLLDENDNPPVFTQPEYRADIPEHSPMGTKVLQVKAMDKDSGINGRVMYTNLVGSDAFHLNQETGEITVDKPELLDRETEAEIRLYVEAKDGGYAEYGASSSSSPSSIRNVATGTINIKLHDKNDNRPEFLQKYYQAVLTPDMSGFKSPLQVKAFDMDEGPNGQVKYQSLDPKFFVDPTTGEVRIRGVYQRKEGSAGGGGPYLGSFRIKAYDLGNPQQNAETVVQLFSEEMVTREIQFVFPATPDKIRKNQTNIEKMLSSLTGGIVGIQKITPIKSSGTGGSRAGLKESEGDADTKNVRRLEFPPGEEQEEDTSPPATGNNKEQRSLDPLSSSSTARGESQRKAGGGDKSLVTATVQYPVSSTPTRVDLSAFQKTYGNGGEGGEGRGGEGGGGGSPSGGGGGTSDNEMIKLYEAENRALFWLLITFLMVLLILFSIFLCCIYCPCCWLYGHCYSKGGKDRDRESDREVIIEKQRKTHARKSNKTYPAEEEETEDSIEGSKGRRPPRGYYDDNDDVEAGGGRRRRGRSPPPRRYRREAWSGDETVRKGGGYRDWRRYRPPTPPPAPQKGGGQHGVLMRQDVSLEDWEFEPQPRNQSRLADDRMEEIGPRWQHMHGAQTQTVTVPVPIALMPAQVQQQLQQQQQPPPRRVGYAGHHPHPGDEDYVRRSTSVDPDQFNRPPGHPRHYPRSLDQVDSAPISAKTPIQRETRFFKTENAEVLQFADAGDDDEGKELLMKRYMDDHEQHRQEEQEGQEERPTKPQTLDKGIQGESPPPLAASTSTSDRPRAAVISKRPQQQGKPVKHKDKDDEHEDDDEDIVIRDEIRKEKKPSIRKPPQEREKDTKVNKSKRRSKPPKRRSQSLSDEQDQEDEGEEEVKVLEEEGPIEEESEESSRTTSKAKSKSKVKSKSTRRRSRSRSRSRKSRSHSPSSPTEGTSTTKRSKKTTRKSKETRKEKDKEKHKEKEKEKAAEVPQVAEERETTKATAVPVPVPIVVSTLVQGQGDQEQDDEDKEMREVDINIIPPSSAAISEDNEIEEQEKSTSVFELKEEEKREQGSEPEQKESKFEPEADHDASQSHEPPPHPDDHQDQDQAQHENDDEDSGIGITTTTIMAKRNSMLEKKSVFTIAYNEVAQKTTPIRPDTGTNSNNEGEVVE